MNNTQKGILQVNLAALLMGGTALFPKLIAMSALSITFGRSLISVLILFIFLKWKNRPLRPASTKDTYLLIGLGVILAVHWVTYFYSVQLAFVAVGAISMFTYPIITVLLEPYFFQERLQFQDIVMAGISFLGVFLIMPEFTLSNQITQSILFGVFSAFLFAIRNILSRKYVSHYPGTTIMFYQLLVVVLCLFPFLDENITTIQKQDWMFLLILGVFFTALPHSLFVGSLSVLKAKTASIITNLVPLYATIFATIFLSEIPTWRTLLGGFIVVSCGIYESLAHPKK